MWTLTDRGPAALRSGAARIGNRYQTGGAASRDAVAAAIGNVDPRLFRLLSFGDLRINGRGDRIGVVKLLRARGGCLGVIRNRAWKAAISPGELPNERRTRNTRKDPGN